RALKRFVGQEKESIMLPPFPRKPSSGCSRNLMGTVPEGRRRRLGLFRLPTRRLATGAEKEKHLDAYVTITNGGPDRRGRQGAASWKLAPQRTTLATAVAVILVVLLEMVPSVLAFSFTPPFPTPTAQSNPTVIVAGPDGNLWFTETTGNRIGRITP